MMRRRWGKRTQSGRRVEGKGEKEEEEEEEEGKEEKEEEGGRDDEVAV